MKGLGKNCAIRGVLLFTVGFAATVASAANKGERVRAASEAVQEALRSEISGTDADRSELLRLALEQVSNYPPAMWQTGHVKHGNKWVKHDEVPEVLADDRRVPEYRHRRQEAANTLDEQLALAQWCLKHKLADRARAHLTALLEIDPNHAEARRLLGHRRVDGAWLSEQEIREASLGAQQIGAALRKWKPELEEIRRKLEHRSERQREVAAERLLKIDEVAAIPAMETVLSTYSEEAALLVVRVLDEMDQPEAAGALARQAVFSPWEPVRRAAATALAKCDPACYAPQLLSAMSTPVQTRANLYRAPSGRLMYRHALYREGQEQAELAVLETEYRRTVLSADDPASWQLRRRELEAARLQDAAMKAQVLEATAARQNALIRQFNDRICWVLSRATGQQLLADPQAWWNWWNQHNEVFVEGSKPVRQAYHRSSIAFDDPGPLAAGLPEPSGPPEPEDKPFEGGTRKIFHDRSGNQLWRDEEGRGWFWDARDGTWMRSSCLIAGTPVWTDSGAKPIEQLRVGDLVLSQNPTTGELAYKPVLKTTLRPPTRLLKLVFGDKALQCSGGHPFWIAGKGWVFARDLGEGMRLHTVEGTAEIRSVHPTGSEQLHNLVVADFHTYFVTDAKILTHDNTIREPVSNVVPGLVGQACEQMTDARRPKGLLVGAEPRKTR